MLLFMDSNLSDKPTRTLKIMNDIETLVMLVFSGTAKKNVSLENAAKRCNSVTCTWLLKECTKLGEENTKCLKCGGFCEVFGV
jgi:hypothetical protein